MKRSTIILLIIVIFLFLPVVAGTDEIDPLSITPDLPVVVEKPIKQFEKIMILSGYTMEYMQNTELASSLHNISPMYDIHKFYLKCTNSRCSEVELENKFTHVWQRILHIQPDYLIIYGNLLWEVFSDEIIEYSKQPGKKVGLFNVFLSGTTGRDLKSLDDSDANIFVSWFEIDIEPFIAYAKTNGKQFTNFYILRDSSPCNLFLANRLKDQLYEIDHSYRVSITEILNDESLKTFVITRQHPETQQGLIIPFFDSVVHNDRHVSAIYAAETIADYNKKHVEISLTHDYSKALSYAYKYITPSKLDNFKKSPKTLHRSSLLTFLNSYKKGMAYFKEVPYLIMNEQRVRNIFHGDSLLNFTNDHVDFIRND